VRRSYCQERNLSLGDVLLVDSFRPQYCAIGHPHVSHVQHFFQFVWTYAR
jgi:hypothetical protein